MSRRAIATVVHHELHIGERADFVAKAIETGGREAWKCSFIRVIESCQSITVLIRGKRYFQGASITRDANGSKL